MNTNILSLQSQYTISIECSQTPTMISIAGFCAAEQTENIFCKHLSNLCLQSDGSFLCTQQLIVKLMTQWQQCFNMNATQTLQTASYIAAQNIQSVCLYKMLNGKEKLINKISF